MTAYLVFGLVAIAVAETVSGLVQIFPVRNAIYQYTVTFLDKDLALVAGVAYWLVVNKYRRWKSIREHNAYFKL